MKRIACIILLLLPAALCGAQTLLFPFRDTTLGIQQRVEDLMSRLTLDEKLAMLEHHNPGIERLGLKPYSWWNEALHGVARNGAAHVYPMPVAMAATFDPSLVRDCFHDIASEGIYKYALSQKEGNYGDNAGISFFTPNVNIFRDPRWGRGMETYGEDPYLTAMMGAAVIRGLQGNDTNHLISSACVKHLAVHSGPEGKRHEFDAQVSTRDLWCTYLPAFQYLVKNEDVEQVMCGYNRLNGEPCCTSRQLLTDILRNRWHYNKLIVTDCWALNDCWERDTVVPRHRTHATAAQAAREAFGTEVDLECGSGLQALKIAVDSGYIGESRIDEHLRRILSLRLRLELEAKSTADVTKKPELTTSNMNAVSCRSIVLLQNRNQILPLRKHSRIAVVGPNADDSLMALGNYNGFPERCITIRQAFEKRGRAGGPDFKVYYHPACPLVNGSNKEENIYNNGVYIPAVPLMTEVPNPDHKFWRNLKKSDAVIFCGGLSPALEGEELQVDLPGFHRGDRSQIELPVVQRDMIKEIRRRTDKPIILVLCTGSAIGLEEVVDDVDAIIVAWYGGEKMGEAVEQCVTTVGRDMGLGRLPVTFYRNTKQLPPFDDYNMEGRTYRYMNEEPLFPFGYGLSDVEELAVDTMWYIPEERRIEGLLRWRRGDAGNPHAVIQVYLKGYEEGIDANKTLVAFVRTDGEGREGMDSIALSSEQIVSRVGDTYQCCPFSISLDSQWMTHFDEVSQQPRPFKFGTPLTLLIGTSSADRDLKSLKIVWQ